MISHDIEYTMHIPKKSQIDNTMAKQDNMICTCCMLIPNIMTVKIKVCLPSAPNSTFNLVHVAYLKSLL